MSEPAVITTITDQLTAGSQGLLKLIPEPGDPTGRYLAFDDAGVETEIGELLYGLVRATKPLVIAETGTARGVAASYMAAALDANGAGHLTTIEWNRELHLRARQLFSCFTFNSRITALNIDARTWSPTGPIDFFFSDSEPDMRFDEVVRVLPWLNPGGFIAIHDCHATLGQQDWEGHEPGQFWPWGHLPRSLVSAVVADQLRVIHPVTPRGLSIFQKVTSGTYRWDSGEIS